MLKENKIYEINVTDMGHSGEGIGRIDGITVFTEGVLIGDQATIRIIKTKKNYAVGELVEIITPSKDRIEPICSVADLCGGCQIMQMNYPKQLELKHSIVKETLQRIGGMQDLIVNPVLGMENPLFYRNKSQYPIRKNSNGEVELGFFQKKSHDIVPITRCYIDSPNNEPILNIIKNWIEEQNIAVYNETTHQGNLRQIILRTAKKVTRIMVILVTRNKDVLPIQDLVKKLMPMTAKEHLTIIQNINPNKTNVILGKENKALFGKGIIEEELQRLYFDKEKNNYAPTAQSYTMTYRIYPSSFFQVNTAQTEVLYSTALDFAAASKDDIIFDLYCGLGSISLFLAKEAKKVYGVEIVEEAVKGARENAALNHIGNAEFIAGKTEEILPKLIEKGITPTIVLLDPPRKGCEESVLHTILRVSPQKIVYVSCNPATLARDAKLLVENGYRIEQIQPVDLFGNTVHIEVVTKFVKR